MNHKISSIFGCTSILSIYLLFSKFGVYLTDFGYAVAEINGKYGIIDTTGNWIVKPQFDKAHGLTKNGLVTVKINGCWGLFDINGHFVIKPQFEEMKELKNGLLAVKKDGKWGLINSKGKIVAKPQFDEIGKFEFF